MRFLHPSSRNVLLSIAWVSLAVVVLLTGCGKLFSHPHSVTLSWTASKSSVVGYNVYRILQPNGQRVTLTPQPITETKYVDKTVEAGQKYTYFVTAVASNGAESPASDSIVAVVPSP